MKKPSAILPASQAQAFNRCHRHPAVQVKRQTPPKGALYANAGGILWTLGIPAHAPHLSGILTFMRNTKSADVLSHPARMTRWVDFADALAPARISVSISEETTLILLQGAPEFVDTQIAHHGVISFAALCKTLADQLDRIFSVVDFVIDERKR